MVNAPTPRTLVVNFNSPELNQLALARHRYPPARLRFGVGLLGAPLVGATPFPRRGQPLLALPPRERLASAHSAGQFAGQFAPLSSFTLTSRRATLDLTLKST